MSTDEVKMSLVDKKILKLASEGHHQELEAALKNKGNPNVAKYGVTALHQAVRGDHATCVAVLLKYGADVFAKNVQGQSALEEAIDDELSAAETALTTHLQGLATSAKTDKAKKTKAKEMMAGAVKQRIAKGKRDKTRAQVQAKVDAAEAKADKAAAAAAAELAAAEAEAAASDTGAAKLEAAKAAKLEADAAAKRAKDEKLLQLSSLVTAKEKKKMEEAAAAAEKAQRDAAESATRKEASSAAVAFAAQERARTQELNAKTAEEARAVKLGNQAAAKGKLYWEARKKKRSALVAEGIVVEGAIELSTGKGPLGGELWKPKYLVFDQRRHRLEVHDPFERPPVKGNKAKTPQPATFAFERVARVRSGTAEYKKQGIRGRRHRVDVDCADWAHKDEDESAGNEASDGRSGVGDGFEPVDAQTETLTAGAVISVVFDSAAMAQKLCDAINSAQRAREAKAREDTVQMAKKKEGLFWEKREQQERLLMKKEETRSRSAEEEFERVASSNAEDRKARAKQAEADKLKREAEAVQEAEWAAERKLKAEQDKEAKKKAAEEAKKQKEEDAKKQKEQEKEWAKAAAEEKAAKKKADEEAKKEAAAAAKAAKANKGGSGAASSNGGVDGDGDVTASTPSTHMPSAFFKAEEEAEGAPNSDGADTNGEAPSAEEAPVPPPKAGGCCVVS